MGRWHTPKAADGGAWTLASIPLRQCFALPPPQMCFANLERILEWLNLPAGQLFLLVELGFNRHEAG
jgi:hypothetical protein